MSDAHVLPIADWVEHDVTRQCLCRPEVRESATGVLVVHHSYDGREWFEPDHEAEPVDG